MKLSLAVVVVRAAGSAVCGLMSLQGLSGFSLQLPLVTIKMVAEAAGVSIDTLVIHLKGFRPVFCTAVCCAECVHNAARLPQSCAPSLNLATSQINQQLQPLHQPEPATATTYALLALANIEVSYTHVFRPSLCVPPHMPRTQHQHNIHTTTQQCNTKS